MIVGKILSEWKYEVHRMMGKKLHETVEVCLVITFRINLEFNNDAIFIKHTVFFFFFCYLF